MFEELAYDERHAAGDRHLSRISIGAAVGRWLSDAWYLLGNLGRRRSSDAY